MMSNWTPEQWGIFFAALALFISTAITPLFQMWLNRGVNKKIAAVDQKVTDSAIVSDQNNAKLTQIHGETVALKAQIGETQ